MECNLGVGGARLGRAIVAGGAGAPAILAAGLRGLDISSVLRGVVLDIHDVGVRGRDARIHLELLA